MFNLAMKTTLLTTLLVFKNTIREELIRSVHVYQGTDGKVREVEREFVFSENGSYGEMRATPILTLQGNLCVSEVSEGYKDGLWLCIFSFHSDQKPPFSSIPSLLLVSRSPKLRMLPTLLNDLQMIYKLECKTKDKDVEMCKLECKTEDKDVEMCKLECKTEDKDIEMYKLECKSEDEDVQIFKLECKSEDKDVLSDSLGEECQSSRKVIPVFEQDLNCLPCEDSPDNKLDDETSSGSVEKKRRAPSRQVAKLTLTDLVKYFDMPIVEASRQLNVGLTVLKRKCREFGIPRWPHRKIKSLDSLIHDLQEEVKNQEPEDKAAAMAAAEKKRMLESEKENIERKPFMDIKRETKRFRQDMFKRRHKAKALGKQNSAAFASNKNATCK